MNGGGILRRLRTAGLTLALFALTFKALLPPGFMLDTSGERIAIALCNGGAAFFDTTTGEISHERDGAPSDNTSQHCPFAFVGAPTLTDTVGAVAPASRFAIATNAAPARQAIGVHDATGPPLPARGPPLHA
ncbi:DUF2946 family protein [Vitreimonas flagellata]|uniref:DUF2946 family protein n=1 Tax=Vitreimonas flagellata TaxID=2560861 RepID=UPI001074AE6F|nr:DUF2946 family protein [Vitreimonas flagellata]